MGVRDAKFWSLEAQRRGLVRRAERYRAALLPEMAPEERQKELGRMNTLLLESDFDPDDLDRMDREAQEKRERDALKPKGRRKKRPRMKAVKHV